MELEQLSGLGPTRLKSLRAAGIDSLRDLLFQFPVRYEDHMTQYPCNTRCTDPVMIIGKVDERPKIAWFHGKSRVTAKLYDGSGSLALCWYNEPWMAKIPVNTEIALYGRITDSRHQRVFQNPKRITAFGWEPVYRQVKGIPAKTYRSLVEQAIRSIGQEIPETLPASFLQRNHLIPLTDAIRQCHFPESPDQLTQARRRLSFENTLMYLIAVAEQKRQKASGWAMNLSDETAERFWNHVPFRPTTAQKRVLREIERDLCRETAMSRLVQGDVGCGKTVVAFGAIFLSFTAGFQSAMMAPTEILARQHYESSKQILEPLGIHCELLTGNTGEKDRRKILDELEKGTCHAIFGTHALISENVNYRELGLVITDEQHRFGVRQRSALQNKGICPGENEKMPHVLVMSATPIPRTLALILYGDLDLSVIDELPPGRKPVKTFLVPGEKRHDMYQFLRREVAKGRQAYIVCPLVEDSESLENVKSAKALFDELSKNELKELRVGLTWGQQKPAEKERVLEQFLHGETDVLIATTVIEVGVNVPNATVMIIENAERFGLSQLHQLRGRVGRGEEDSWCFLLASSTKKLQILCRTNDGFLVAQKDLEQRGPGDLTGTRQSGEAGQGVFGDALLLDEVNKSIIEMQSNPDFAQEYEDIVTASENFLNDVKIALN